MLPPASDPSQKRHCSIACVWEASARKAGNVHRFADFDDVTYVDFIVSALAIAPVMEQAPRRSVGRTILDAVEATRAVVETNTNLGMVLLLAPLAKASPADGNPRDMRQALAATLAQLTVEDARLAYEAIRVAKPGGLGEAPAQDVAGEPTLTLREAMALAAERDRIARQYACNFADVFDAGVPALLAGWQRHGSVEGAILHCQLELLAAFPDSLIARKRGLAEAERATVLAQDALSRGGIETEAGRAAFRELDGWLRAAGHQRNPGTTADLVTASLFVALREGTISPVAPFPCSFLHGPTGSP